MEIRVTNVNQALHEALYALRGVAITEYSRNGTVLVFPGPVTTVYDFPQERVLFSPLRDANPFFHLFEAIWMMAGRDDIAFPAQFNKNFTQYSDDGVTAPGAYGNRWRNYFGYDQLWPLVNELKENPNTRRAVLTLWDGGGDDPREGRKGDLMRLREGTKDAPCNTHVYFDRRGDQLNMTVCCRSNDLWWGAYGANAVHFSVLQEWVAAAVGVPLGVYHQFSNNLHLYTSVVNPERLLEYAGDADQHDYYQNKTITTGPLVKGDAGEWLRQAEAFCDDPTGVSYSYTEPFFAELALPLYAVWSLRRAKNPAWEEVLQDHVTNCDWKVAVTEWIARREAKLARTGS